MFVNGRCGIRIDGSLYCRQQVGEITDPGPFSYVEEGTVGICALKTDGTIKCWGPIATDAPGGTFISVTLGETHACVVQVEDGQLACWGGTMFKEAELPF